MSVQVKVHEEVRTELKIEHGSEEQETRIELVHTTNQPEDVTVTIVNIFDDPLYDGSTMETATMKMTVTEFLSLAEQLKMKVMQ